MEKTNPAAYERYLEICVLHGGKKISFYRTLTYGDPFDVDFNT
jgi:hypothetical protein